MKMSGHRGVIIVVYLALTYCAAVTARVAMHPSFGLVDAVEYSTFMCATLSLLLYVQQRWFVTPKRPEMQGLTKAQRREAVRASWADITPADPLVLAAALARTRRLSAQWNEYGALVAVLAFAVLVTLVVAGATSSRWWWVTLVPVSLLILLVAAIRRHNEVRRCALEAAPLTDHP